MALNPPTPVPQRPSAREREAVIETLRDGCEHERLSLSTFAERVGAAHSAGSRSQLELLVADLPARSRIDRAIGACVGGLSRFTARLSVAWDEPRTPRLSLPASGTVTLGRGRDCDCVLNEPTVSRRHARLRCHGGSWYLRDLGSANGTRVNGWRVTDEVEVRPGDRISLGATAYRLGEPVHGPRSTVHRSDDL